MVCEQRVESLVDCFVSIAVVEGASDFEVVTLERFSEVKVVSGTKSVELFGIFVYM